MGLQDSPDATLYTSGFSFFPGPLGTILGTLLGIEGLAIAQALVIGAVATSLVALRVPLRSIAVGIPVLIFVAMLALLLGLVAGVRVWEGTFLALGVALTLGKAYAIRFDLTFRYALPVVFVCFIEAERVFDRANEEGILVFREADA